MFFSEISSTAGLGNNVVNSVEMHGSLLTRFGIKYFRKDIIKQFLKKSYLQYKKKKLLPFSLKFSGKMTESR